MNSDHTYVLFPLDCTRLHKNKQLIDSFCSCVRKHLYMGLSFQGGLVIFIKGYHKDILMYWDLSCWR